MTSILKVDNIQKANGSVPKASDLGINTTGTILQVVGGITTTYTNVASTTFADTTLTATITPSATSSKILIIISQNVGSDRDNNSAACSLQLLRGSTVIQTQAYVSFIEAGGSNAVKSVGPWAVTHLDSPSTTNAITYKTQGKITSTSNNGTARFQWDNGASHITLLEIQG